MRTNIVIDDEIMKAAMRGGEYKTKREAVEAGLRLLARQQHNREVLKWEGKLHWDDSPAQVSDFSNMVMESRATYGAKAIPKKVATVSHAPRRHSAAKKNQKAKA